MTDDDLEVLGEALEAWETKDVAADMLGDLMEQAMGPRLPEGFRAQRLEQFAQRRRAVQVRKDRSVLLRAKLLTLRDRRRVERGLARE